MPKDEIQKIINLLPLTDFFTYYGLTEASRSTFLLFNDDITKIESVGKPAPNVEIKIIPNTEKVFFFILYCSCSVVSTCHQDGVLYYPFSLRPAFIM